MLRNIKNKLKTLGNEKKCFLLLSTVLLLTVGVGSTAAYIVTGTPTLFNRFLNGMNPDGNLIIEKTVDHPFGEDYVLPEGLEFIFTVDLGEEYAGKTLSTTQGEKTADENGVLTVSVAPGDRTTIFDIDEGRLVTVAETNIGEGFTPDETSRELIVQKYQDNILTFRNTYVPKKANTDSLQVSGVKTLVGRDWQEGDSFTFLLEVNQAGTWKKEGTQTITYELVEQADPVKPEKTILVPKPDFNKFDFTALIQSYSFDKAGTYSFRISETEGSIGGITYDKAESRFDVLVGDVDMDGYLEIQSITSFSGNTTVKDTTVNIDFENKYAPAGSAEAFINIRKIMEDTSGQGKLPEGFTFELYDEEGNLITTSEPTNAAGEAFIRLVYEPTDAGKTFNYILKETNAGKTIDGMSYDAAEHHIQIDVVDNLEGTVSAYIYGYQGLQVVDEPAETTETKTTVESEEPKESEDAVNSEETTETEDTEETPEEETTEETVGAEDDLNSEKTTETEGNASSEETKNSGETTENMEDKEKSGDATESETPEDTSNPVPTTELSSPVEIDVVFVSEPAGAVDVTAPKNNYDVTFTNTYDPEDASVTVEGTKTLDGRVLRNGEFTFHLYQTEERFEIAEGAQPLHTAVNALDGTFGFGELRFETVGTYYYVVKEDTTGNIGGVIYDETCYLLTIAVTDTDGVLSAVVTMTDAFGEKAEQIAFKNTYRAAKVSLPLGGKKRLTGAELKADVFIFQIAVADETFKAVAEPFQTVTNTAEGTFKFNDLVFDKAGTYRYVVTEDDSANAEGMTYDDTVYCITAEVTDPGDGQLVVSDVSMTADGETVTEIVFENTYKAPVTPEEPDEPEEPDNSEKPEDKEEETPEDSEKTPEVSKDPAATGDNSNMMLYAVLMILALGVAILGRKKWQK